MHEDPKSSKIQSSRQSYLHFWDLRAILLRVKCIDEIDPRLNESVRKGCLSSKKSSRFLKGTDIEEVRDDVLRNLKSLFGEKVKKFILDLIYFDIAFEP